ncbi:MAG: Ig-like domain-containing protein [Ruminococcus sp.]|nr:Ig-like domain-containing protein [Ruminococcus sp.]
MDLKKILAMSMAISLSTLAVNDYKNIKNTYAVENTATVLNLGDVDNNGLINAIDATMILTEYAFRSTNSTGVLTEAQKKVADVNGDNLIDSVDAALVLSYYAYKSIGGTDKFERWLGIPDITTTTTTTQTTETTTTTETAVTTTVSGYTASLDTSVVLTTTTTAPPPDTTTTTTTTTTTVTADTETTTTTSTTAPEGKISEIKLTKYEMNLKPGEKDISYVTMLPEEVANKDEIWTSSDENVATVDKWGNVIAIGAGTCTVTVASVDNPAVKAEIKVTVKSPTTENKISEIKLTKYEMNLKPGERDISYVTMLPANVANQDEIWTSSDEKIATVDKWGYVTAISAGTCTVTVTSVDNPEVKAEIKVTVKESTPANKITEIRLTKYEMNLTKGQTDISYVTMLPESVANKEEIWTSSNQNVATVDKWGNVIAIGEGTCTVTVASVDNPSVKAEIKVTVKSSATANKISEIRLSKYEMNLTKGQTDISYVTMLPSSVANQDEIWASSDTNVATVDRWGNVTAVSAGTCTVTVTSVDNPAVKADIKVTVKDSATANKISEIRLSKYAMNLNKGQTDISYVTMLPSSVANQDEIWTSSDTNVATVDRWGNVTALSAGTCTVTVTSVDNPAVKAEIKVTVTDSQSNFQ